MSQENVEIMRKGMDAWNQHDAGLWLSYAAPDVEWMPAGPAAVERTVYRGHDEVASGFAAIWETWDLFQLEEAQIRDLGDSVLWLGRVKMRGSASQIPLYQEFAVHTRLRDGQVITVRSFHAWREALEAVGLSEQDAHADS